MGEHAIPEEIATGIWRLPIPLPNHFLRTLNSYLLRDRDGYLLVDCGYDLEPCREALASHLAALSVPVRSIHTCIVTHGHADHFGMASPLATEAAAEVAFHPADAALIEFRYSGQKRFQDQNVRWLARLGFPDDELPLLATPSKERVAPVSIPTRPRALEPGAVLDVGEYRLEVLWTPGHTPGHICLYDRGRGLLIGGDHVLERVTPNVGLLPYSDENHLPAYLASLGQLADLDLRVILPGHGRPILRTRERIHEIIARHEERQAQLQGLLNGCPRTPYELAGRVWADARPTAWPDFRGHLRRNAVSLLAAHLLAMADDQRVQRDETDGRLAFRRLT